MVVGTALGAVPLVWAAQWKGGHILQWGGRYLLVPTLLLLVLAAVALEGPVRRRLPARSSSGSRSPSAPSAWDGTSTAPT